jgi:DHA1 family tetracycline resistance protein-like MFS transporter
MTRHRPTATIFFILMAVLIDMIAVGVIMPVLPSLVGTFAASKADNAFWYGVVACSFGAANFIGAPILGALSDRFGRRPILLTSFAVMAGCLLLTGFARSLAAIVVLRFLSGFSQSNVAIAQAAVADVTEPAQRGQRFGLIGSMVGLGYILGPVLGGLLGGYDLHLPFFVAGGLAAVNSVFGMFVMPETLPAENRRPLAWQRLTPFSSIHDLASLGGVGPLAAVIALAYLAQFILPATWALMMQFKFGWGPRETGWSLFAYGLMLVIAQGVLIRFVLKRRSPQWLTIAGLLSAAVAFAVYGLAWAPWMIYAAIATNVLGFMCGPAMTTLVSQAAGGGSQGRVLGSLASLNSVAAAVAPAIGSALLVAVSGYPADDWRLGMPFYASSLLLLAAAAVAAFTFRRPPSGPQPDAA